MDTVCGSVEPYHLRAHNERLQSLRGLAAMVVMISHASLITLYYGLGPVVETVFQRLAAVMFFFVLSGFVLSESIRKTYPTWTARNLAKFVVRRLFRLYPMLIVSVLAAWIAGVCMYGKEVPGTSSWYASFLHVDTSLNQVWLNLSGLSYSINGVLWSVQVEIIAIFLLPLLMAMIDRLSLILNLLVFAIWCGLFIIAYYVSLPALGYAFCFYLGALLPYLLKLDGWRRTASNGPAVGAVIVIDLIASRFPMPPPLKLEYDAVVSAVVISFVLLRRDTMFSRLLNIRPFVQLGDISYSFYAFGQVALAVTTFVLMPLIPIWPSHNRVGYTLATLIILGVSLAIVLPLSAFTYRFIERPAIALGARLTGRKPTVLNPENCRANAIG